MPAGFSGCLCVAPAGVSGRRTSGRLPRDSGLPLPLQPMIQQNVKMRGHWVRVALDQNLRGQHTLSLPLGRALGHYIHHKHQQVPHEVSAVAVPFYAPTTGVPKPQKNGLFPLPRCARRATPWTRAGALAHLYDSGTCMRRCGGCAARCHRRHMLCRPYCCTHPSSTAWFRRGDT